ncbi:MAG: hypothetical protein P8P90_05805 [Opitutales bacterium]|nr:hypothetical protein [Opitutales bacterium]
MMWAIIRPTRWAFSICMEMCGSGPQTGTRRPIPAATRWWIPPDRPRARIGSSGVVPGATMERPCVQRSASATPPATATAPLASVLVSKSSSKGAMYGRMTDIAEGEGGAGRAWTKGAVAQMGHARHAEPGGK